MNRFRSLFASLALAILTIVSTALADWSHTTSYKYAGKTSLKVLEPEGFRAKITVGGEVKEDTIPTVFQLPDGDAFLPVSVVARDGTTWSQKIEIKDKQQTELKVSYTAKGAPPAGPARKFIGSAVNNTHRCGNPAERGEIRIDFMRDGVKAYEFFLPANRRMQNIEIAQGEYDVRIFQKRSNGFIFIKSKPLSATKDGWEFSWGC